jgi:hypothetical protein
MRRIIVKTNGRRANKNKTRNDKSEKQNGKERDEKIKKKKGEKCDENKRMIKSKTRD